MPARNLPRERLICDLARAGYDSTAIGRKVDCHRKTVRMTCERYGVTLTKAKPMAYAKLSRREVTPVATEDAEYRKRATSLRWGAGLGAGRW